MGDPKALMKEGEEALKTSLFKWEADHIAAASLFEKAGKAYRAKGDGESAMGAYLKAVKSHLSKGGSGYEAAAAAYQAAAQAYPPKAAEMYMKSVDLYTANGSSEESLEAMGKAADNFEKAGNEEMALALYTKAIDLVQIDEHTRAIVVQKLWTLMNTAFRKLIAARRLPEASKCANKMLSIQKLRKERSPKMVLQIVILYLARGDIGAARNLVGGYLEDADFVRSSEGDAAQDLIDAYERLDSARIVKLVEGPVIKYLDTQVVYLARELDPAGKTVSVSSSNFTTTSSTNVASQKAELFSTKAASTPANVSTPNAATGLKPSVPAAISNPAKAATPVAAPVAPTFGQASQVAPKTIAVQAPAPVATKPTPAPPVEEPSFDFDLPDIR